MSHLPTPSDRRLTPRWLGRAIAAIAGFTLATLANAQLSVAEPRLTEPEASESQVSDSEATALEATELEATETENVSESSSTSWVVDSDELNHFSNRANRATGHPELPGVRPIGFVQDERGLTVPLLSVGGTLRQIPIGETVANGWRVVAVDRDSVEVSDGTQSLRLPFERLERSLTTRSEDQFQPESALNHDESN